MKGQSDMRLWRMLPQRLQKDHLTLDARTLGVSILGWQ